MHNVDVGHRMKQRRKELGLSADLVAEKIGVSRSNVYRYEKGDIEKMPTEILIPLSEVLKTTPAYLMGWDEHDDITIIYNQLERPRQTKVYNFAERQLKEQQTIINYGSSAAGPSLDYSDGFVEEEKLEKIPSKASYTLTIKGDSMEPEILNGSKVFVQPVSMVENGEIAIVELDGEGVTCKKIRFDYDNQKVILESINTDYTDMIFDNSRVRIVGKVVK